jgi:hypothetical protein
MSKYPTGYKEPILRVEFHEWVPFRYDPALPEILD